MCRCRRTCLHIWIGLLGADLLCKCEDLEQWHWVQSSMMMLLEVEYIQISLFVIWHALTLGGFCLPKSQHNRIRLEFFLTVCTKPWRWPRPTLKLSIAPTQPPICHHWPHTAPSLFVVHCVAGVHVMMIWIQRKMIATLTGPNQTNLAGNSYEMRRY